MTRPIVHLPLVTLCFLDQKVWRAAMRLARQELQDDYERRGRPFGPVIDRLEWKTFHRVVDSYNARGCLKACDQSQSCEMRSREALTSSLELDALYARHRIERPAEVFPKELSLYELLPHFGQSSSLLKKLIQRHVTCAQCLVTLDGVLSAQKT